MVKCYSMWLKPLVAAPLIVSTGFTLMVAFYLFSWEVSTAGVGKSTSLSQGWTNSHSLNGVTAWLQTSMLRGAPNDMTAVSPSTGEEGKAADDGTSAGCKTMQRYDDVRSKGWVEWNPSPNRYLLAMCDLGQLNNRLFCLRHLFLNAALLDRALILPSQGPSPYNYSRLLDLSHFESCLGPGRVILLEDMIAREASERGTTPRKDVAAGGEDLKADDSGTLVVDRSFCEWPRYHDARCRSVMRGYEAMGVRFRDPEIRKGPSERTISLAAFRELYGSQTGDRIVAFASTNGFAVEGFGSTDSPPERGPPLRILGGNSSSCAYVLQPHPAIVEAAQGFVDTYLGREYIALHWRRGDFFEHCRRISCQSQGRPPGETYPVQQVSRCLSGQIRGLATNASVIFLLTNAEEEEVGLLTALLRVHGLGIPLLRVPPRITKASGWGLPLTRLGWEDDGLVRVVHEMAVAALSEHFIGTLGSTLSEQVRLMREWWAAPGSCRTDQYVCDTMA